MPKPGQDCLVIYSAGTSRIRRIVSADDRSTERLKKEFPCIPGEACSVFVWSSMQEIQSAVEAVTGIPVGNDRYVCVDPSTGIVDRVLRCDPECGDLVQGHTLERHDTARIGWRQMLDGSWQRDLEQIQKNIDHEERSKTAQLALVPGGGFPLGPTQTEIDSVLADTETRLQSLLAELAAREAPR